jgi:2-haloacid dehalogenase
LKYTTLLFDADGTLYDFDKAEDVSLRSFYNIQNPPCSYEQFYEVYEKENALLWKALEEGKITGAEVKVKRFENTMKALSIYEGNAEELSSLFINELAKCDFLLDGAMELVENISSDYKMLFITNGLWDVQRRRIGLSPIYKHFDGLIVSEKVGSAKPDSVIFDETMKTAANPPKKEVLIIGDNLNADILGGNRYGIDSCWYNPGKLPLSGEIKPTHEVHSFAELEELLSS